MIESPPDVKYVSCDMVHAPDEVWGRDYDMVHTRQPCAQQPTKKKGKD